MEGLIFGILRYQRTSLVSIKYRVGCAVLFQFTSQEASKTHAME